MPIYVATSSREEFGQNQASLTENFNLQFNPLNTATTDRKTRVYAGHTYIKEGMQGSHISLLWRIRQAIVAVSSSLIKLLSFNLADRNPTFHKMHKHAWMELKTGKQWQSLYLRIEPEPVLEVIRPITERIFISTPLPYEGVNFSSLDNSHKIHALLLTAEPSRIEQFIITVASDVVKMGHVLKTIDPNQMGILIRALRLTGNYELIKWTIDQLLLDESANRKEKLDSFFSCLSDAEQTALPWLSLILVLSVTSDRWPPGNKFDSQKQEALSNTNSIDCRKVLTSLKSDKEYQTFCSLIPDKNKVWEVMRYNNPFQGIYSHAFVKGVFNQSITKVDSFDSPILEKFLEAVDNTPNNDERREKIEMIVKACRGADLNILIFYNIRGFHKLFLSLYKQGINLFEIASISPSRMGEYVNFLYQFPAKRNKYATYLIECVRQNNNLIDAIKGSMDGKGTVNRGWFWELFSYQIEKAIYDLFPLYLPNTEYLTCLNIVYQLPHKYRNLQGFFESLAHSGLDKNIMDWCLNIIKNINNQSLIELVDRACQTGSLKDPIGKSFFKDLKPIVSNPESIRGVDFRLWGHIYDMLVNHPDKQTDLFNVMLDEYKKHGDTEQQLLEDLKASSERMKKLQKN